MHEKSRVSSAIEYNCFKLDGPGNCIIRKTWLHCIWFEKKLRLNEVIPHCTRSVNCRLCLRHFNEYHTYEYYLMNKSNKFLEDQNVIQSLEQQFDYLFKCAGVKLMSFRDLKEHHIIIIINKNQKGKISIEFPQYFICLLQMTKFHWGFSTVAVAQWVRRCNSDDSVVQAEGSSPGRDTYQTFSAMIFISVF